MPRRRVLNLLVFFFLCSQGMAQTMPLSMPLTMSLAEPSVVKVKLLQTAGEFAISSTGLWIQGQDFSESQKLKVQAHAGVGGIFWSVYRNRDLIAQFKSSILKLEAEALSINGLRVPNTIELKQAAFQKEGLKEERASAPSTWIAIAQLKLDEYLSGVLKGEMPQSWPIDALRAQAVVARTFTLFEWQRRSNRVDRDFDFESDVRDQVYVYSDKILPAVQQTHGLYLTSENGKIEPTYFHSDCGGHTESARYVWGGNGTTQSVQDEFCPFNPKSQWTLVLSPFEILNRLLRARAISIQDQRSGLRSLEVLAMNTNSRVQTIRMILGNEKQFLFTGQTLRQIFGFTNLKSTMFSLRLQATQYVFSGRGAGHGVGLCQWGSRNWAKRGFDFKKILAHYFPQSSLHSIHDPAADPARVARANTSFADLQTQ